MGVRRMRVKLCCKNPMCRVHWSTGIKVELVPGSATIGGNPPSMTATLVVTPRRLPVECPACGEVSR